MKHLIIAIDGYSSCGKSTLAKDLATALHYRFIDTGAMYRAVALFMIRSQIDIHHPSMVAEALPYIRVDFRFNASTLVQETILNGENVEQEIRINPRVASVVSDVSAISEVRKYLVKLQQEMGSDKRIVMDGRDIGTVVFPDADLKLFITADPMVRANRRWEELKSAGQNTTLNEVLANLEKRDHIDTTRADSPLRQAEDARILDNSNLTKEEQFNLVMGWIKEVSGQSSN